MLGFFSDLFKRLNAARDILDWDNRTQNWNSTDGMWYSLNAEQLEILEQSIDLFSDTSRIGFDFQNFIVGKSLHFVKNILSHPEPSLMDNRISQKTWQLMFNIVEGNKENQSLVWKQCNVVLLNCLQRTSPHKDTCRFIIFQAYVLGHSSQNEGAKILKILLKNFNDEIEATDFEKNGLNILLEYFVCEEKCIAIMFGKLNTNEKIWLLQFTNLYLEKGQTNVLPISVELMCTICKQLKSKGAEDLKSCITDSSELQEILALFRVIATASKSDYYGLNQYSFECFELILRIGSVFRTVVANGQICEKAYMAVSRNSNCNLKLLILETISNIVKGNSTNREKVKIQ